jgi:argininosuccinate synthase
VSREDCLDYAALHHVEVEASRTKIHSRDRNLWHVSHEGGELEGTDKPVAASTWRMSQSPQDAPDRVELVEIEFERGTPVSVNGQRLPAVQLVELLNEIGGRNAIGRIDIIENRFVGMKSRGAYETPGGTLILEAIRQIESLTLDRETAHTKETLALKYAELVYFGLWFTPLREALDAFFTKATENVTGSVKMALYKGNISYISRSSPVSLYNVDLSSFTMGESYDQKDAAGFIKILGLPARVRAQVMAAQKEKELVK